MRRGVLGLSVAAMSLAIAAGALAASTRFVEAPSSPEAAGDGAAGVVAADFDGDLDLDLAVANGIGNSVTVLRNNGAGNFAELHSSPEFPGAQPNSIVAADFDADGDPDLATANVSSDNVRVLRNNGSGNFQPLPAGPEDVGDNPTWLAAADLDGDEDLDLAVTNQDSDDISILRNKGNGHFSPETRLDVGDGPRRLVIADLNGDSHPDLAVANTFDSTVTLLRGLSSGGAGFAPFSQSPIVGASGPSAIVAPDLNGDGTLDLAFTNSGSGNVSVFRGLGGGRFRERSTSPEDIGGGFTPLALTAADFDVDGAQDLAVAVSASDRVAILRNTGSGNLSPTRTSPVTVGDFPLDIAAADLDGDGDLDIATANGIGDNVTILRNR